MESRNASAAGSKPRGVQSIPAKPIFVIRLQATRPTSSGSAIRGLRWILKTLGRAHGFRCIDIKMDRESCPRAGGGRK